MRTLTVIKEFDQATYQSPHRLLLDGVKTGVRWNGDTKKELYGEAQRLDNTDEFAWYRQ